MSEEKNCSKRVELSDECMDVSGGRMSFGEAMAEAQQDTLNGGDGNFFKIWLKHLFGRNNKNTYDVNDTTQAAFDGIVDNFQNNKK